MTDARIQRARDFAQLRLELGERVEGIKRRRLDLNRDLAIRMHELRELRNELRLVKEELRLRRALGARVGKHGDREQANDQHGPSLLCRPKRLGDPDLLEKVESLGFRDVERLDRVDEDVDGRFGVGADVAEEDGSEAFGRSVEIGRAHV